MKKLKKLKLSNLNSEELKRRDLISLRGGYGGKCTCACVCGCIGAYGADYSADMYWGDSSFKTTYGW